MLLLDLLNLHTNLYLSAPLYLFGNKPILCSFLAILAILTLLYKLFSGGGNLLLWESLSQDPVSLVLL